MYIKLNLNDRFWDLKAVAMVYCHGLLWQVYDVMYFNVYVYVSLAYVCCRWLTVIAGVNPAEDMDVK